MLLNSWLRSLPSVLTRRGAEGKPAPTRPRQLATRFRPRLELLEDRTAPAVLTVTTLSDLIVHTGVSLRDAIATANVDAQNGASDTIQFDSGMAGGTVLLSQGQLVLGGFSTGAGFIQIDAPGLTGGITINGQHASRILRVDAATAEIDNLTLENGYGIGVDPAGLGGGAIYNGGSLTLNGCTLSGNIGGE